MPQILIVEDEAAIADTLIYALQAEGFLTQWSSLAGEALRLLENGAFDLAILDVGLPDISGFELCKRLRRFSEVPVIFLTARDAEIDRVVGLEIGADDYVVKPFSPRELLARINAVLRRRGAPLVEEDSVVRAGGVELDADSHVVVVRGRQVSMPLKEFELLEMLLRNVGRVLTRVQLIDRVWGSDYVGDTKTLDVHIKRLRAKVEPDPAKPVHIVTVRGLGYKFEA